MPRLALVALLLAATALSGYAGDMNRLASPSFNSMMEVFPYKTDAPIARELRYTYTSMWILNDKPYGKPRFGADAAFLKDAGKAPRPEAVIASAIAPASGARQSDKITQQARELDRRGGDKQIVASMHGLAASAGGAEASLGRAQATVQATVAIWGGMAALSQMWTAQATKTLGEWVRDSTGVIGPAAPEGTVLQVDYIFVLNARKWRTESRVDFLAVATLVDGNGGRLESRQGYQLYTVGDEPKIEVPKDTIRLLDNGFPADRMPLVKKLQKGDVWGPYLALAMSAALADLQKQVRGRP